MSNIHFVMSLSQAIYIYHPMSITLSDSDEHQETNTSADNGHGP
jgi:hypothetical protein